MADRRARSVTIEPQDGVDIENYKKVVADHLNRFAFREPRWRFIGGDGGVRFIVT